MQHRYNPGRVRFRQPHEHGLHVRINRVVRTQSLGTEDGIAPCVAGRQSEIGIDSIIDRVRSQSFTLSSLLYINYFIYSYADR